jgi:acetate kinase
VTPLVVLCVNSGSSSVKCAVFRVGGDVEAELGRSEVTGIGSDGPADHRSAVAAALGDLGDVASDLDAAGHRVVHGGPDHIDPARVDDALLASLQRAVPFAPLHLPAALAGIEAVASAHRGLPQVACFDTAFHRTLPEHAARLPLPDDLWRAGVRKYGFHGLSYEYVVDHVGADVLGRAVVAHLGNGASLAAIRGGSSIDTTMGFTPTGGIPMSTRTGDLDPGVLVYLVRDRKLDAAGVEELIDRHGGLLGYSGTSGDMKELLEARDSDPHAGLAVDAFCYRIRLQVGAYAAALGGLDTLVFTGGIGEHAAAVRTEVCAGLEHLGVALDDARNTDGEEIISAVGSACTVRVVQTNEDLMVARHTHVLLGAP